MEWGGGGEGSGGTIISMGVGSTTDETVTVS